MADEGFKRKLAAILSADVEGYSRLMDDDEEATVRTLTSYRTAITDLVQQYRGRVVDSPGDNILAEFASVVDAVNCAVEIQRDLAERNTELPYNRQMQFRIGINLGDVIEEDGRIYGDGVNIAARVESLSEAGGICISGRAHDQVENKLGLEYEDLGKHEVKNISRPIQVYRVLSYPGAAAHRVVQAKESLGRRWRKIAISAAVVIVIVGVLGIWQFYMRHPSEEPASVEHMAFPLPDKSSIAVLPFVNMSGDPEQEYFSDGLTDELIGDLAKISGILVISRNSAFTYKGKQIKISEVAKDLNVRYVLEGSVQKSGDRVRIRAQLIDGQTDHHLWAESYDGVLNDIFDLQDKITSKIVSALAIKLSPSEQERVADKGTDNALAYEAFLKGNEHELKKTPNDFLRAIEYYKQAIKYDPTFSRAYAALGAIYKFASNLGFTKEMGLQYSTSIAWSRHYLKLALKNPTYEAFDLAAAMEIHKRNYKEAITFAQKRYNIAPNSSAGNRLIGWILSFAGKPEESIEYLNQAVRLDPIDTESNLPICFIFIGISKFSMENFAEAATYVEKGLSLNPKLTNFSCFLAASYALLGEDIKAKNALTDFLKMDRNPPNTRSLYYSWPFKDYKVFDYFAEGLAKAGLKINPTNYYKLDKENKLNGREIKNLMFGKTTKGIYFGIKGFEWSSQITENGKVSYRFRDKTHTGNCWIEEDSICTLYDNYLDSLATCSEIYRNPKGNNLSGNAFSRVTDFGIFLFAVEK